MRGHGFSLARALNHKELGQDCHAFQPDGETPEQLHDSELEVEQEGKDCAETDEVLHLEGVYAGRTTGVAVFLRHQPKCVATGG